MEQILRQSDGPIRREAGPETAIDRGVWLAGWLAGIQKKIFICLIH